ncbi:MAG: metallophosphoesterase [Bacteroidetes bacterium]|nr:MAG: metallophosphoesterase [Bacteroidota bacterium]
MILSLIILLLIILFLDFYGYYGLRKLTHYRPFGNYRKQIILGYWIMDVCFIVFSTIWTLIIRNSSWSDYVQYRNYFYITGAFVLIFLPKIVYLIFNLLHDIVLLGSWIIQKASSGGSMRFSHPKPPVLLSIGFVLSLLMFVWVLYGVVYGRFNFKVKEVEAHLADLPEAFDGFRIIHISDTHFGSFARTRPVRRGVDKIKQTPHDMLVFTGDMVNNEAVEAEKYVELFAGIDSPYGKFSILGNHDMGDYRRWYTIEEKAANLQQLQDIQADMNFVLLRNDHRFIVRGNDSILLAGVDNWGLPPFAQLGDLDKALNDHADFPVKILLSHDPSHWTEQVIPDTDIALTLSGHTHGMQAGLRTSWFQFSPVSLKYENWNGLYDQNGQLLYVNRGFGFIGFPGRMGMRPEITLLVLRSK